MIKLKLIFSMLFVQFYYAFYIMILSPFLNTDISINVWLFYYLQATPSRSPSIRPQDVRGKWFAPHLLDPRSSLWRKPSNNRNTSPGRIEPDWLTLSAWLKIKSRYAHTHAKRRVRTQAHALLVICVNLEPMLNFRAKYNYFKHGYI